MDAERRSSLPRARTGYLAELQRRRDILRAQLEAILSPGRAFTWELGCGHGHFLAAYAQAHPEKLCIGIDMVSDRIRRAVRKRDRARLENLFFLHAEARLFLDTLPSGVGIAETFIMFPDPWPKVRHHKHRILQSEFLVAAAERATENSRLYFRTDFPSYFEQTERLLTSNSTWQLSAEAWPFEFCTVFQRRAVNYQSLVARRTPQACAS